MASSAESSRRTGQDSGRESPEPNGESSNEEDEGVDPRVEDKLEQLNKWTDMINELETRFEEKQTGRSLSLIPVPNRLSRTAHRSCLHLYSEKLKALTDRVGEKTVRSARVYYEAKKRADECQAECQSTVSRYEQSCRMHHQARDDITRTEDRFQSIGRHFDPAAQELMNQSALRLQLAEQMKVTSEERHEKSIKQFLAAEQTAQRLKKQLKHSIAKSEAYFIESEQFKHHLTRIKEEIEDLNEKIADSKRCYSHALKDLELISEEIHARRNRRVHRQPEHNALAASAQSPPHHVVPAVQTLDQQNLASSSSHQSSVSAREPAETQAVDLK